MFWNRNTTEAVPRALIETKWASRRDWVTAAEELIDRYLDTGSSILDLRRRLQTLYPNNAALMSENLLRLNVVKRIVDTKAMIYKKKPMRRFYENGESFGNTALVERYLAGANLNETMKWANRWCELLNCIVLWVQADPVAGKARVRCVFAHDLLVEPDPDNPQDLAAARWIAVPLGGAPDGIGQGASTPVRHLKYGISGEGKRVVQVTLCDENLEPLPMRDQPDWIRAYNEAEFSQYPFVAVSKVALPGSEMFPDVPHEYLHASRWVDHELTRGALNTRQADFPAYVYNGTLSELGQLNPATGAGAIFCLGDENKRLEPIPVETRESERNENLQFFLKIFAQNHGLSTSTFSLEPRVQSGVAKFHDKQCEVEYRQDMIPIWQRADTQVVRRLFELTAMFDPFATDFVALQDLEAATVFPEAEIPLSRHEVLENRRIEIELGTADRYDFYAEDHGQDRETARKDLEVKENENETDES